MRKRNLAVTLVAVLLVCLVLAACSAKQQQAVSVSQIPAATSSTAPVASLPASKPASAPAPPPMPDTVFEERSPGDPAFIEELIGWVDAERTAIITDERNDVIISEDLYPTYADAFANANVWFREEDYSIAADCYAQILEECPGHLGAMNNYALAMMHLDDYHTALQNIVLLGTLQPDYQGTWANFVVGCYALGYDARDVLTQLHEAGLPFPEIDTFISEVRGPLHENALYRAYAYNSIYSSMEFPLRYIGPDADAQQDMIHGKLASGAMTAEEANNLLVENNFTEWETTLEDLNRIENDADIEALLEYARGLRQLRTMDE